MDTGSFRIGGGRNGIQGSLTTIAETASAGPKFTQGILWLQAVEIRHKISLWWLIGYTWTHVTEMRGVMETARLSSSEERVHPTHKFLSSTHCCLQIQS